MLWLGNVLEIFWGQELELTLPLLSKDKLVSHIFKTKNVGFYKNSKHFKIQIPGAFTNDSSGYTSIDAEKCSHTICPVEGLHFDHKTQCIEDMFSKNNISRCIFEETIKENCEVESLSSGTLVSAEQAIFIPSGTTGLHIQNIKRETLFLTENGKVICQSRDINQTIVIERSVLAYNSTFAVPKLSFSNWTKIKTFKPLIRNLQESLDLIQDQQDFNHIEIHDSDIHVYYVIFLTVLVFGLCYYAYRKYETIKKEFLGKYNIAREWYRNSVRHTIAHLLE